MSDHPEIRPLRTPEEMRACEDLQQEVWGFPDREVVPVVELVSAAKAGGCVAGAFDGATLVGFVYGMWGLDGATLYHYSRMVAVKPTHRGRNLGRALKSWQRDFVLKAGVDLVRWTFDPLEGPNASLNLGALGAVADHYIEDYYGMKADALNRGLPTDRLFVKWFLRSPRVEARLAGRGGPPPFETVSAAPALLERRTGPGGREEPLPRPLPDGAPALRVEIPGDIQALKRADLALALSWRMALREALQDAFARGYRAAEFVTRADGGRRTSLYLLERAAGGKEDGP